MRDEVEQVLWKIPTPRLAEFYVDGIEPFFNQVLKITDLKTQIYIILFLDKKEYTNIELSRELGKDPSFVLRALKFLRKRGCVEKTTLKKWRICQ